MDGRLVSRWCPARGTVPACSPGAVEVEGRRPLDPDEAQDVTVEPDAGLDVAAHPADMVD